jgi:hypothetical protein
MAERWSECFCPLQERKKPGLLQGRASRNLPLTARELSSQQQGPR